MEVTDKSIPDQECRECVSVKINWQQVLTIGLGVTAGLVIAGVAARVLAAV